MKEGSRRDFCMRLGLGAGAAAVVTQGAFAIRSILPNVSYDAPTSVKLGLPETFPEGMKYLPDERLFVFREGSTFHAVSANCTHLGCTVRAESEMTETRAYVCPCHGSVYAKDGTPKSGPAPTSLAWFPLAVSPDDGQLVVDLARPVDAGTRLTIA